MGKLYRLVMVACMVSFMSPGVSYGAAYGAVYYNGNWDPDADRGAVRVPQIYPDTADGYLPTLPAEAFSSGSPYNIYGPNGCADVQISVGSGSNGALNRKEVTVNMKPGQLLILRPQGASKHSYAYTSYINDNKGRRFSDFAKLYHSSDSHYSRLSYAWLMRVSCGMAGDWDAYAAGWDTVNNDGDRVYYGPAHWTMHLNVSHPYGAWVTTRQAGCTSSGIQTRTCSECGNVETRTIPVLGHAYGSGYYTGADDGTYYKRCTRQGCTAKTDICSNPYTVRFHPNMGVGQMEEQAFVYHVGQALTRNRYTRDYHIFQGWNTRGDGKGTAYEDGQDVVDLTAVYEGCVMLYAQWNPESYWITFHDGMDGSKDIRKKMKYSEQIGPLPTMERSGYTLEGFYTDAAGGEMVSEETDVPHEDTSYHAHWRANTYDLRFHVQEAVCDMGRKAVTYGSVIGELPTPAAEDYCFLGWYTQPYGNGYVEKIPSDGLLPQMEKRIGGKDIYLTDGEMDVYAYLALIYEELENGVNRRPGADGVMGTEDDSLYINGKDGIAGTGDDRKIYPGKDGFYGTQDDHYLDESGNPVHPGPDRIFGTADDYRDNRDGTNARPGPDHIFGSMDDLTAWNGMDEDPGTDDDWMDNGESCPSTNIRPGPDQVFNTLDDGIWFNGADGHPGNGDDTPISQGQDGKYGTKDDWYDNDSGYPCTNIRPGSDRVFGTEDDEVWFNGPDRIPGNEDDMEILPGPDGQYGTSDDCHDNSTEREGTNIRPGLDGIFGTDDDELWLNGIDGKPGTDDDTEYVPGYQGGGTGWNTSDGKSVYVPYMEGGPGVTQEDSPEAIPFWNVPDTISDTIKESISKDGNKEADSACKKDTETDTDDKETGITVPHVYWQDDNPSSMPMEEVQEPDWIHQLNEKVLEITGILLVLLLTASFLLKRRKGNEDH